MQSALKPDSAVYHCPMSIARDTQKQIQDAVDALRAGDLVAFPTETVYGLGANASSPQAVRKIFELKGRPANHPVIVHVDDQKHLQRWVRDMPPAARALADKFWPGPLTLVMKRAPAVSDVITGGQDTVAVRVPSHPIARQLLTAFGGGVAAPSANRYGHVSPTRAEHVRDEFGKRVKIVLDGGDCKIGLESTIVLCVGEVPRLLRPGAITLSQLRSVVPGILAGPDPTTPRAPGTTPRHYSPKTPVTLVPSRRLVDVMREFTDEEEKVAVLSLRPPSTANRYMTWINAGTRADIYARNLYTHLRTLDKMGAKVLLVEEVPAGEQWDAVRDRLKRAASKEGVASHEEEAVAVEAGEEGDLP
jgi:L-threonylcarbamoyladenylate synthase